MRSRFPAAGARGLTRFVRREDELEQLVKLLSGRLPSGGARGLPTRLSHVPANLASLRSMSRFSHPGRSVARRPSRRALGARSTVLDGSRSQRDSGPG
jgi:hypothetical protein